MAWTPPTLSQLRTKVWRDLRDPNADTFTTLQIDDFIQQGVAELNEIRPYEQKIVYQGDQDFSVALPFSHVFAVELAIEREVGETLHWDTLHPADSSYGYGRSGWDYYGRRLILPGIYVQGISNLVDRYTAAQVYISVWGYGERVVPTTSGEVLDFDTFIDESITRAYAKAEGLRSLGADRALFQQWQLSSNNADVSETQLNQMLAGAQSEFDRMRKRHYTIRRTRTG